MKLTDLLKQTDSMTGAEAIHFLNKLAREKDFCVSGVCYECKFWGSDEPERGRFKTCQVDRRIHKGNDDCSSWEMKNEDTCPYKVTQDDE